MGDSQSNLPTFPVPNAPGQLDVVVSSSRAVAVDAPPVLPDALPVWHKDIAMLDQGWADEAASVIHDLAASDRGMVQANAFGSDGEKAALAYNLLLRQMQALERETVKRGKSSWLDNLHRKFMGDKRPLVERMEELMKNRQMLVNAARSRVNGMRAALDLREDVDSRASQLLERMPALEARAQELLRQATEDLANTPEEAQFSAFREIQLRHRNASKVPAALLGVRQQLQNAVMMGVPLRDSIDQFLHLDEMNQSNFELSFGAHVSNLAILQGMQQSALNANAAQAVIQALPRREAGRSTQLSPKTANLLLQLEQRRMPADADATPGEPAPPARRNHL